MGNKFVKYLILIGCGLLIGAELRAGQAMTDFDTVINALKDSGNWQSNKTYNFVYQPKKDTDWAPYRNGQWIYTDYGWTWKGSDPGSWVVDHYGFWTKRDTSHGEWVWVPGEYWLPASVEWLQSQGYLGWRVSKLDRFSNAEEQATARYSDPSEWNFVPAAKIREVLTEKDFVPFNQVKDLLVNAQPIDHTFASYRMIDRPGPDPSVLQVEGKPAPSIPNVGDLPSVDAKSSKAGEKDYLVYRPKFYQDESGIMHRIELFLNPQAKGQKQEKLNELSQQDAASAKKQTEDQAKYEEKMELQRKHDQDLYR